LRDAGKLGVISAPIVDVAGNITVGVAEQDVFGVPSPTRRWIRHIAGGTGHVLWEREVETQAYEPPYFTFYSPPNVFGLSDCVMTTDTLVSDTRAGMKCLSNMDGSVRWVSSLMDGMPYVLDAATAVFVSWSTSVIWRKFDLKTGDILWQTTLSDPGISTFSASSSNMGQISKLSITQVKRHYTKLPGADVPTSSVSSLNTGQISRLSITGVERRGTWLPKGGMSTFSANSLDAVYL
jgi:hypothetical protein